MIITGQCQCGAISFTALVDLAKLLVCHRVDGGRDAARKNERPCDHAPVVWTLS